MPRQSKINLIEQASQEEFNDVGVIESVLSGVGSGLIDIPKGLFSLGAALYDLGAGTNKAAQVEKFFDDLTTLDEKAKATTAGQITKLLVNIGVPGGVAYTKGAQLASKAIQSKRAGTYFLTNSKNLAGQVKKAAELNKKGKAAKFVGGVTASGAAEGVFVGDAEEAGTIGDLIGGPTQIERGDDYDPSREIMNRIKFGTEGALFTSLIGGIGKAFKRAKKIGDGVEKIDGQMDKLIDNVINRGFRPEGRKGKEFFKLERTQIGERAADVNFASEISRGLNKDITALFPTINSFFIKAPKLKQKQVLSELNDALLSGTPTVSKKGVVELGAMDPKKLNKAIKTLKSIGAEQDRIDNIKLGFEGIRGRWGEMFSAMGTRMTAKDVVRYKELFGTKFKNYMGSTYEMFENKSIIPFLNYKPSNDAIQAAKNMFREAAAQEGKELTEQQLDFYVDKIIQDAKPPRGFALGKAYIPSFTLPDFFVKNSALDDLVNDKTGKIALSDLTESQQKVINDILGKQENPLQTILAGTERLSLVTRRNQFYSNLLRKSNQLQEAGERGMFFDTPEEAIEAFGSQNVKRVDFDPQKTIQFEGVDNPLQGKFTSIGIADGLTNSAKDITDQSLAYSIYQNLLLVPKGTAQLAKTVLSPITHVRNLTSAGAFATANGIIPNPVNMKKAYQALQAAGPGMRKDNEFYRELLELGVVNSNVRYGDLKRLMQDLSVTNQGLLQDRALRGITNALGKVKKVSEDLYTAEDDFWKITTFLGEQDRLARLYKKAGVTRTAKQIKEEAASIVRNNVPNYDYVPAFVKSLRNLPVGNFASFPAEIVRTSMNIVERGLDEILFTTKNDAGKTVAPLRALGVQRLAGMAMTTAAVPLAAVEAGKTIYNFSEDELQALKRYVADWAKNSTIIPLRDRETGELKYMDFSRANAYDTLTRPIQSVINAVAAGRNDKDGIMDDFTKGLIIATKEFLDPFISESIWTESLNDLYSRGGRTSEGFKIWNDQDKPGVKFVKGLQHIIEAQAPFSYNTFKRLDLATDVVDVIEKGKFDKYGQTYEFGDEALGFIGLRAVKLNPERGLNFKTAAFQKGVRDSRQLFTVEGLRGGPITAEQLVDQYINANRALYGVKREFNKDIMAARTLGVSEEGFKDPIKRVGRREFNAISENRFNPLNISEDVREKFEDNARKLGVPNPFEQAEPAIEMIRERLQGISFNEETIPDFVNPLRNLELPSQSQLPQQVAPTAIQTSQITPQINPNTMLTPTETALLSPTEQLIRQRQRT